MECALGRARKAWELYQRMSPVVARRQGAGSLPRGTLRHARQRRRPRIADPRPRRVDLVHRLRGVAVPDFHGVVPGHSPRLGGVCACDPACRRPGTRPRRPGCSVAGPTASRSAGIRNCRRAPRKSNSTARTCRGTSCPSRRAKRTTSRCAWGRPVAPGDPWPKRKRPPPNDGAPPRRGRLRGGRRPRPGDLPDARGRRPAPSALAREHGSKNRGPRARRGRGDFGPRRALGSGALHLRPHPQRHDSGRPRRLRRRPGRGGFGHAGTLRFPPRRRFVRPHGTRGQGHPA
jgi:hypothetical protein